MLETPFRKPELLTGLGGIAPTDGVWAGDGKANGADIVRSVRVLDRVRIGLLDGIR